MQLYTLVSLIIGIFGSTYAALNALRTNLETKLTDTDKAAAEQLAAVASIKGIESGYADNCKKYRAKIQDALVLWRRVNLVPAIVFLGFMIFIALLVLLDWNLVSDQLDSTVLKTKGTVPPWSWMHGLVWVMFLADMGSVGIAVYAWFKGKNAACLLDEHHGAIQRELKALQYLKLKSTGSGGDTPIPPGLEPPLK